MLRGERRHISNALRRVLSCYTIQQFAFDCDQTLQQGASW